MQRPGCAPIGACDDELILLEGLGGARPSLGAAAAAESVGAAADEHRLSSRVRALAVSALLARLEQHCG